MQADAIPKSAEQGADAGGDRFATVIPPSKLAHFGRPERQLSVAVTETIPLTKDCSGVYRVGHTRVTLDLVVRAFNRGATAEEIVQKFPSLELSDVYQVIGYYLKYRTELVRYFETRERGEKTLLADHPEWAPVGLRERLMARRQTR